MLHSARNNIQSDRDTEIGDRAFYKHTSNKTYNTPKPHYSPTQHPAQTQPTKTQ